MELLLFLLVPLLFQIIKLIESLILRTLTFLIEIIIKLIAKIILFILRLFLFLAITIIRWVAKVFFLILQFFSFLAITIIRWVAKIFFLILQFFSFLAITIIRWVGNFLLSLILFLKFLIFTAVTWFIQRLQVLMFRIFQICKHIVNFAFLPLRTLKNLIQTIFVNFAFFFSKNSRDSIPALEEKEDVKNLNQSSQEQFSLPGKSQISFKEFIDSKNVIKEMSEKDFITENKEFVVKKNSDKFKSENELSFTKKPVES